jgi:Post-segregation antitoxin CcdA
MDVPAEPSCSVYSMRMGRVNITMPDELLAQARAAGLNVSRLAASAVAEELDRLAKIAELDAYLSELNTELGPLGDQEVAEAREWGDQLSVGSGPNSTRPGAA